jgi:outer membrane protein TolC
LRALEVDLARDVKNAWLSLDNSSRRLQQTAKLVEQATRTLKLATSRYDLGLGSIVELNQAQLSVAAAETAAASARYEYQIRRVNLDFEVGRLQ